MARSTAPIRLFTSRETGHELGLHPGSVARLAARGKLTPYAVTGTGVNLFRPEQVARIAAERRSSRQSTGHL